jgi:hypothetical protein
MMALIEREGVETLFYTGTVNNGGPEKEEALKHCFT